MGVDKSQLKVDCINVVLLTVLKNLFYIVLHLVHPRS